MDASKSAFDAAAEEFMLRYGAKPSELHRRLRRIATAASKDLPPLKVMYNSTYGKYGYSKEFQEFIWAKKAMPDSPSTICALQFRGESTSKSYFGRDSFSTNSRSWEACDSRFDFYSDYKGNSGSEEDSSHKRAALRRRKGNCKSGAGSRDDRVRHAELIASFAEHVTEKWPGIAKLVNVYMRNDLGHQMQTIQELVGNRLVLEREKRSIPTRTKQIWDAKRDALLMHMTEAQYEAMVESCDTKFAEEKGMDTRVGNIDSTFKEGLSFTDAIAKYGDQHYAVWHYQSSFNPMAMRFLLLHPEYIEQLASRGEDVDFMQTLGLCAASPLNGKLKIAEVPRTAEWTIGAYNRGVENVDVI